MILGGRPSKNHRARPTTGSFGLEAHCCKGVPQDPLLCGKDFRYVLEAAQKRSVFYGNAGGTAKLPASTALLWKTPFLRSKGRTIRHSFFAA